MIDLWKMTAGAIWGHRLRSGLSLLGIAIGIASVVLLTSIGEGTRQYMLTQFTQFGTKLFQVNPGKTETVGLPGVLGGTTHQLTIDDAVALERIPGVEGVVPLVVGTARVEAGPRGRSVVVYGSTAAAPKVWQWGVRQGTFLAPGDPQRTAPVAVIGPTLKRELFSDLNPLGRWLRIGGGRFRVVGVMEPKGRMLGFDIDDAAYIPVASALRLFNREELTEIDILYGTARQAEQVEKAIRAVLIERHGGNEDFTIISQAAMVEVFGNVMGMITASVGAIAGISLLVGAVGILTMMWIAVGERTQEIGVLRSLGATRRQVQGLFLAEAALLSTLGGLAGLAAGWFACLLLRAAVPALPISTPPQFVVAAVAVSVLTGLVSGVLPARRAARLSPLEALRAE